MYIHFSSDYVFDGHGKNYREINKPNPINVLGRHKLLIEKYIAKNLKNYLILRISWLFSEYNNNFVKTIYQLISKEKSLNIINDLFGNPTSASSVVKVLERIIKLKNSKKYKNSIFHFCNYPKVSWHLFAETIFNVYFSTNSINQNNYVNEITSKNYKILNNNKFFANRPKDSSLNSNKIIKILKLKRFFWYNDLRKVIINLNKST